MEQSKICTRGEGAQKSENLGTSHVQSLKNVKSLKDNLILISAPGDVRPKFSRNFLLLDHIEYQIFRAAPLADDGVADRGQVRHEEHAAEPLVRLVQHEGLEEGVLVLSRGGQCGWLGLLEGQKAII